MQPSQHLTRFFPEISDERASCAEQLKALIAPLVLHDCNAFQINRLWEPVISSIWEDVLILGCCFDSESQPKNKLA